MLAYSLDFKELIGTWPIIVAICIASLSGVWC